MAGKSQSAAWMLKHDTRISLADLVAAGVRLRPSDAVTIVREVALQVAAGNLPGVPSAHVIRITPAGSLLVEGPVAAGGRAVSRAAQLLESLLSGFDVAPELRVPGPLRLVLARALEKVDLPPYPSLEAFAEALARFGSTDPSATLRDLANQWTTAAASAQEAVFPTGHAPALDSSGELSHSGSSNGDRESGNAPTTALVRLPPYALTVSDVRRARRATGLVLADIAARSGIAVPLLRQLEWGYLRNWPSGTEGRTQLVSYARAVGLDEASVVDAVWPLVEEQAPAPPRLEGAALFAEEAFELEPDLDLQARYDIVDADGVEPATALTRKRTRWLAALAIPAALTIALLPLLRGYVSPPRARNATPVASVSPRPHTDFATQTDSGRTPSSSTASTPSASSTTAAETPKPLPSPPDSEPNGVATSSRGSAPTSAPVADENGVGRRLQRPDGPEARRAEGLTGEGVTYSPAFAAVGSAMFYQVEGDGRSSLMRADTDSRGAVLRITRVVDDASRNFHARPSPDGSQIAFDSDREGVRAVYVADSSGHNVRRVSGDGFAAVPSWSPDGGTLAFVRAEPDSPRVWNLWTVRLDTGAMQRVTSHRFGQPWGGSWFPDGRRIAYSHEDRLVVLDLGTGRQRVYPSPRKGRLVRTPAVSPDGRLVMFQVYRDGAWLLDLTDGSMRKILADPSAEEYSWSPDGRRVAYHSRRSGEWGVWVMATR